MTKRSPISNEYIYAMSYVDFMAFLGEVNRPPGGKNSIRKAAQNAFISKDSNVLDIGCNTGYCAFELAHLVGCKVVAMDISREMITVAKNRIKKDSYNNLINFMIADAHSLPFQANSFDAVISGGSTVFMSDIKKVLKEVRRVLKPWGFFIDINFFYYKKPPLKILKELNKIMGTDIQPWTEDFFLNYYRKAGYEIYHKELHKTIQRNEKEVKEYCRTMAYNDKWPPAIQKSIYNKLYPIMKLFSDNNQYLSFGIFILRNNPEGEQISLFEA